MHPPDLTLLITHVGAVGGGGLDSESRVQTQRGEQPRCLKAHAQGAAAGTDA